MANPSLSAGVNGDNSCATNPKAGRLVMDELRAGALELAWTVRIASEIDCGESLAKYCQKAKAPPSEDECCALLDRLTACCRSFRTLRGALNGGQEPDYQAWLSIVRQRPNIEFCLNSEMVRELNLCKGAFFMALEECTEQTEQLRGLIARTSLPERVKSSIALLPDAVLALPTQMRDMKNEPQLTMPARMPAEPRRSGSRFNDRAFALAIQELDSMVGLDSVKECVRTYANLVKLSLERERNGDPALALSMNFVFKGNPGTGKTSVARCLGRILKAAGLLESGHLVEVDRSGLVAGYVGQSEAKSEDVFKKALGGVLLIDEAYGLTASGKEDFGRRALEVILKAMEDHRGKVAVIVAGYPELMDQFISSNPGLQSRFTEYIDFPDYTPAELTVIFGRMLEQQHFAASPELLCAANVWLAVLKHQTGTAFGNGREVRNLVQKLVKNHANTVAQRDGLSPISREEINSIHPEDLPFSDLQGQPLQYADIASLQWRIRSEDGSEQLLDSYQAGQIFHGAIGEKSCSIAGLPVLVSLPQA